MLAWYDRHGRRDLPWKHPATPYRVWVSEIMLQQTQVATAAPYFQRFLARFPDVQTLAAAPLDDVLALWAGLGYYARARNLHKAARLIVEQHEGRFPERIDAVEALPGIGRSTAGAILAQACGQRHAILDGNVKRVLTRYAAIDGYPGDGAVHRQLWTLAERLTPYARVADYTQAIMDLGATVCRRRKPLCGLCPVAAGCLAAARGLTTALPTPKPRKTLPVRATVMLLAVRDDGGIWLEQRPATGLWGGLWSLPEAPDTASIEALCHDRFGTAPLETRIWPGLRHSFSHYHLDITPVQVRIISRVNAGSGLWYNPAQDAALGLPAPVVRLIGALNPTVKE